MKLRFKKIKENPTTIFQRVGYSFQRQEKGEMSFVRELARAGYPRFHIYAKMEGADLIVNIHLDHKKETYGDSTRHHGEYDNDGAVKTEAERIWDIAWKYCEN